MNYSGVRFFIASFFCILLVGSFSRADYLGDIKSAWQDVVTRLQSFGQMTQQQATLFGERAKKFMRDVQEMGFTTKVKSSVRKRLNVRMENVYANESATVRVSNLLCDAEHTYLSQRKPKVRTALQKIINQYVSADNVPTISCIMSGGGYRAMLGAIGFLSGLEKVGLLDTITYAAALSGSTWALTTWIATGMSLPEFKEYIGRTITQSIYEVAPNESTMIANLIAAKIGFAQPITTVDIYGSLLANRLLRDFGDRRQMVRLSDLHERIKNGEYPYPICTAIDARMAVAHNASWFEFTPHEVGGYDFKAYIPTWAYGRKFKEGTSTNFAPEQSLGFQMGTFGSAFGVHVEYAWQQIAHTLKDSWFKALMAKVVALNAGKRIFWAEIPNYMFGMKRQELSERKNLKLVDAGLAFNLPYPPVSGERVERKPDVLIICDISAKGQGIALRQVEEYARQRNLPFPAINYEDINQKSISIFKDESNPHIPFVIYLPRVSDQALWQQYKDKSEFSMYSTIENFDFDYCAKKGFCYTTNFKYSREESRQVMDQMEFNVVANKDKIIDVIKSIMRKEAAE